MRCLQRLAIDMSVITAGNVNRLIRTIFSWSTWSKATTTHWHLWRRMATFTFSSYLLEIDGNDLEINIHLHRPYIYGLTSFSHFSSSDKKQFKRTRFQPVKMCNKLEIEIEIEFKTSRNAIFIFMTSLK